MYLLLYLLQITLYMTLEIISYTGSTWDFSINVPNLDPNSSFTFDIYSQLSNTNAQVFSPLTTMAMTLVTTNDRYSEFTISNGGNQTFGDKHGNGMYNYVVKENTGVIDSGSLKLIFSPGGGTGTQNYISDNENREAVVYYTPDY